MNNEQRSSMVDNRQKFWAFITLLLAIVILTLPSLVSPSVVDERISLADKVIAGLIGILGVCAGSLFRHSETESSMAESLKNTTNYLGAETPRNVHITNDPSDPVPIVEEENK